MSTCMFCAIVAGDAPARVVAEDEHAIAFLDASPVTRGHALVIPRRHVDDLLGISTDDLTAVTLLAQRVARGAVHGLGAEGANLLQATGSVAGQTVFHFHVHVLPRYWGDGFSLTFDRHAGESAELDEVAHTLRQAL